MGNKAMQETQEIINMLNSMGGHINNGANYIWPLLVKEAFTSGIISISICIFLEIITIYWICQTIKYIRYENSRVCNASYCQKYGSEDCTHKDSSVYYMILFLLILISIGMLIFSAENINTIINPEVSALKDIIEKLK
jgi:hypothetical protein